MMTSDAKRALAKAIRELREKIILPDLREATELTVPPIRSESCAAGPRPA